MVLTSQEQLMKSSPCRNNSCPIYTLCFSKPSVRIIHLQHLSPFLQKSMMLLFENYHKKEFRIATLAKQLKYSSRQLRRIYQKEVGCPPIDCLTQIRFYKVVDFAVENNLSIKESWHAAGFGSWGSFEYIRKKKLMQKKKKSK